jgi:hypothetical protein
VAALLLQADSAEGRHTLRGLLKDKLPGRAFLFQEEHLDILCQKRCNSEDLLQEATWEDLIEDPSLPDALIVELLQTFTIDSLQKFGNFSNAYHHNRLCTHCIQ